MRVSPTASLFLAVALTSMLVGCDRWEMSHVAGRLTKGSNGDPFSAAPIYVFPLYDKGAQPYRGESLSSPPGRMYGGATDQMGYFHVHFLGSMVSPINPPPPPPATHTLLWVAIDGRWHRYDVPLTDADQIRASGEIQVTLPTVSFDGTDASVNGRPVREAPYTRPVTDPANAPLNPS